jgi:hypothetical protein
MTTETDIEEICRRLPGNWECDTLGRTTFLIERDESRSVIGLHKNPETNADLHMRWLGMLGNFAAQRSDGKYQIMTFEAYQEDDEPLWFDTWFEAIRAALLAKLRSEQDG